MISGAFDAFGVQRFGTGTLSAGVLRATYGNGNEDGMSALLAGRAIGYGPGGKKEGAIKLCKILCDTLICGGLKGAAQKICQKTCYAAARCDNPSGFQDADVIYKTCVRGSTSSQQCFDCCRDGCTIYEKQSQDICIGKYQKLCMDQEVSGGWT